MTTSPRQISLSVLNSLSKDEFVRALAGVFENSTWVAEQAYRHGPFSTTTALHEAMVRQVEQASPTVKLALICGYPELTGKVATATQPGFVSSAAQAEAGLDQCSQEEFDTLTVLNQTYREKFGFPFVLAMRGQTRRSVIGEFRRRSELPPEQEMLESLKQIYQIARYRLDNFVVES